MNFVNSKKFSSSHLQLDIIGITEPHLINRGVLEMDGYKRFDQNRQNLHVNVKKGFGGFFCFLVFFCFVFCIKNETFNDIDVIVLDSSYEGIVWLS